ncbi:MAG: hypothetical protein AAF797_06345 [Planctomycetota bacterium]
MRRGVRRLVRGAKRCGRRVNLYAGSYVRRWGGAGRGREVFLLCSGPSLSHFRFEDLAGRDFCMLNSAIHVASGLPTPPTYVYVNDRTMLGDLENHALIESCPAGRVVVSERFCDRSTPGERYTPLDETLVGDATSAAISYLIECGYRRVVIFGLDFSYKVSAESEGGAVKVEDTTSHFTLNGVSSYGGRAWVVPTLSDKIRCMERVFRMAQRVGVRVVNATPGTRCTVFPCEVEAYASWSGGPPVEATRQAG